MSTAALSTAALAGMLTGIFVGSFLVCFCPLVVCGYLVQRDLRNRTQIAKERARVLHQSIIEQGGRYDPESNTYFDTKGDLMPNIIYMAIVGIYSTSFEY